MADSVECWPNTISKASPYHPGKYQATCHQPKMHQALRTPRIYRITCECSKVGDSISTNPGNHCYTNSGKGDIHRVHYSDPTRPLPQPAVHLPAPIRSLAFPLAPPLACQNPVRYKYTIHPIPCHTSSTCL